MTLAQGTVLAGLGVGLNAVVAEVFRVAPHTELPARAKNHADVATESAELRKAIEAVGAELDRLGERAGETSAEIFEALKMMLEDEDLFMMAEEHISEGWNAGSAFGMAVDEFGEMFKGDVAFEERLRDLEDLARRVHAHMLGISLGLNLPETGRYVIVGDDFSPADTAQFTSAVVGVVTIKGGPTSHTAIICRSKSLPAVVSCSAASELIDGEMVLVDPVGDRVVVGGDDSLATKPIHFIASAAEPIIPVRANIGNLQDAITAATTAAEGVGLFRTELLYLSASSQPSIEQQAKSYSEILSACPQGSITVRTIDAGSDKPVPFLNMPHEENPALGVRGFRLIVEHRDFIEDQLKSLELARQESGREVWVMAPMIATVEEATEFAALARSLGKFKVGVMVETPAIAALIEDLAGVVDFVSIGTNDLSQYLFAADRMNAALGGLLNPWQPGLIRTVGRIATAAAAAGIYSSVCGESASDPAFAVVLAGLGIDSVSASQSQVGAVRAALSSVSQKDATRIAKLVAATKSAAQAKSVALAELAKLS